MLDVFMPFCCQISPRPISINQRRLAVKVGYFLLRLPSHLPSFPNLRGMRPFRQSTTPTHHFDTISSPGTPGTPWLLDMPSKTVRQSFQIKQESADSKVTRKGAFCHRPRRSHSPR
jgi:hypothetical protein